MAQAPNMNVTNGTSKAASPAESGPKEQTAASQSGGTEHSIRVAMAAAPSQRGETVQDATGEIGDTSRRSGVANAEAARITAAIGAETARCSLEMLTQGLRTLQESMTGFVSGWVQSHMRASQALSRITDPGSIFDLQRRFVRDYLDTAMAGTDAFIRLAGQTAAQTRRPLEERIEQRQQSCDQQRRGAAKPANGRNGDPVVVADVMSSAARLVAPDDTVQQATRLMRDENTGVLPVGESDQLVGLVTDRDVVMRLVADGKDPAQTKVREVMTHEVRYVFEDEDLGHIADNMAKQQVRWLPVVNRDKRVVGILSLGDLSRDARSNHYARRALQGVARESGRQMPSAAD